MKIVISLLAFLILSSNAFSSVAYVENSDYRCSNGKTYDVLTHYIGGWGPGGWTLIALCPQGILSENFYSGREMEIRMIHKEVNACLDNKNKGAKKCKKEFIKNNGQEGEGSFDIIHFDAVKGPTCKDLISKIPEEINNIKSLIESYPEYYNEKKDLEPLIKKLELAKQDCQK